MEWLVVIMYLVIALIPAQEAQAVTVGSASLLHGDGYVSGDDTRNVARVDVLHDNGNVMLYGRFDNSSFDDSNSSVNTRIIGHYSVKTFGLDIAGQYQNAYRASASSIGVGYKLFGRDSQFLLDGYLQSHNVFGEGIQIFGHYKSPKLMGVFFEGFVDTAFYKDVTVTLAQPSLM